MWMVVTKNKSDNFRAFHGRAARDEARIAHASENAPLHGFQAITRIGQGPVSHD